MKPHLHQTVAFLVGYGAALMPAQAQWETFPAPITKPGANDCPIYISSIANRVAVRGDIVYVAGGDGLRVYELRAQEGARWLGDYPVAGQTRSVTLHGQYAAVSALNGHTVFDISTPSAPRAVPAADVPKDLFSRPPEAATDHDLPVAAAIVENQILLARDDFGVTTIELHRAANGRPRVVMAANPGETWIPLPTPARPIVKSAFTGDPTADRGVAIGKDTGSDAGLVRQDVPVLLRAPPALELQVLVQINTVTVQVSGPAGQVVRVQRTGNLTSPWQEWATVTLEDVPTELPVPDDTADQMFYRALTP